MKASNNLIGTKLANGATILQHKGEKALCLWSGEFVIWTVNFDTLDACWGHYYQDDLTGAVEYFNEVTA